MVLACFAAFAILFFIAKNAKYFIRSDEKLFLWSFLHPLRFLCAQSDLGKMIVSVFLGDRFSRLLN